MRKSAEFVGCSFPPQFRFALVGTVSVSLAPRRNTNTFWSIIKLVHLLLKAFYCRSLSDTKMGWPGQFGSWNNKLVA